MKQFFCTICKNPAEVVATSIQPGEFGSTQLFNLECPTCSDHISCTVELPCPQEQTVVLGSDSSYMTIMKFDENIPDSQDQTTEVIMKNVVQNIDYDPEGFCQIYGTTTDGVLFYVVLSKSVLEAIQSLDL